MCSILGSGQNAREGSAWRRPDLLMGEVDVAVGCKASGHRRRLRSRGTSPPQRSFVQNGDRPQRPWWVYPALSKQAHDEYHADAVAGRSGTALMLDYSLRFGPR